MKNKKRIVISLLVLIFSIISIFAGNYLVNYTLKVEEDGYIASMGTNVYDVIQDRKSTKSI